LSVGRYRSILAQVFRFRYRYLYTSAGVVADVCEMTRPITGTGVCSNSIECATNTSRKFALAWQLDSMGLWCSFRRYCTLATLPSNPLLPPAATGGRVRELVAIYDDCIYIASRAPRFREICE